MFVLFTNIAGDATPTTACLKRPV